ncbi:MAG: glycosyltransferase family 2 protein [Lutibacter sp.]|nr:glycosyltransferase family 2 protein [Lutibacter sp.]
MLKVFVVIVTYNGEKWIKACLESVINSIIPLSIIVVDNNSTDDTVTIIKNDFTNVNLLEQNENFGFGIANNIGISYALKNETDYVFLLNQDTTIEKDTIEQLVKLAKVNPDYGILSPIHLNGNGSYLDDSFLYYVNNNYCKNFISDFVLSKPKQDIYDLPMINAAAWLLPRNTLETVGGFDSMFFLYGEDDNYVQRVKFHNLKIGITPLTKIRHDSNNNNAIKFEIGSKGYYDKFLNRIKIEYGNVNSDKYKDIGKLIFYLRKQSLVTLLKFDIENYKINRNKIKLVENLNLEEKVQSNRKKGSNYL